MDLILRPLRLEDIDDRYASWHVNSDGHLDYYTTSNRKIPKEDLLTQLVNSEKDSNFYYAIVDKKKEQVIGNVRIGPVNWRHLRSDLVVLIGDRSYLGQGLASVIIEKANKVAFEKHNIDKLSGGMIEDNIPSIKAYIRGGWLIEGILKSHHKLMDGRKDYISVACFNPEKYDPSFMEDVQKNHKYWYDLIFNK